MTVKERIEEYKKKKDISSPEEQTQNNNVKTRIARYKLKTFDSESLQNDLKDSLSTADSVFKGWTDQKTVDKAMGRLHNTKKALSNYRNTVATLGQDTADFDAVLKDVDSYIDQLQKRKELYSTFNSAKDYNSARNKAMFLDMFKPEDFSSAAEARKYIEENDPGYLLYFDNYGYKDYYMTLDEIQSEIKHHDSQYSGLDAAYNWALGLFKDTPTITEGDLIFNNTSGGDGVDFNTEALYHKQQKERYEKLYTEKKDEQILKQLQGINANDAANKYYKKVHDLEETPTIGYTGFGGANSEDSLWDIVYKNASLYKGDPVSNSMRRGSVDPILEDMGLDPDYVFGLAEREKGGELAADFKEFAESFDVPVLSDALSVVGSLASIIGSADIALQNLTNLGDDIDTRIPVNYNSLAQLPGQYSSTIREQRSEQLGDVGGFFYNTGMSVADFLTSKGIGKVAAGASSAKTANNVAGALLAGSASNSAMQDAHARGASDFQVLTYGLAAGVNEMIFERFSLDQLDALKASAGKGTGTFVKNLAKQGFTEGMEELGTDLANALADNMINGELSNLSISVRSYMKQGLSEEEAKQKAALDFGEQLALSFAGGALSGGVMGGGSQVASRVSANRAVKNFGSEIITAKTTNQLLDLAKTRYANNAEVQELAAAVKKNISEKTVGALAQAIESAEISNRNTIFREASVSALRETLLSDGLDADQASRAAEAILKKSQGGDVKLSAEEQILFENDAVQTTLKKIKNGTIGNVTLSEEQQARFDETQKHLGDLRALTETEEQKAARAEAEEVKNLYKVSYDGSFRTESGESVQVGEIVEVKKGKITVNTDKGQMSLDQLSMPDENTALLYSYAADMPTAQAKAFVENYQPGQDLAQYANGFEMYYAYGVAGIDAGKINVSLSNLTAAQKTAAYSQGVKDSGKYKAEQNVVDARKKNGKKSSRSGSVDTSALGFDVKNVDKQRKLSRHQKAEIKVAKSLAEKLGLQIVFYNSKVNAKGDFQGDHGYYSKAKNTVYLDINAGRKNISDSMETAILATLSHELTHQIRVQSPALYAELQKAVLEELNGINAEALQRMVNDALSKDSTLTAEDALEEVVANACEDMLRNDTALRSLLESHKTLGEKIKAFVKDFLNDIKNLLKDLSSNQEISEESALLRSSQEAYNRIAELWAKGLLDASEAGQRAYVLDASSSDVKQKTRAVIQRGMSDLERTNVLRNKSFAKIPIVKNLSETKAKNLPEISSWSDISKFSKKEKRTLIQKIASEFGVFKSYENADISLSFDFSGNNFRESYNKQRGDYKTFAKMFSVFDEVIDEAVGIEVHNRKNYKPDPTLKNVYVLISAFEDGEFLVPVKLEVKEFSDKQNTLYVAIALEGIKKAEVWKQGTTASSVAQNSRSAIYSIADLMRNVNPQNTDFTKYFPKNLLTEEQKIALQNEEGVKRRARDNSDEISVYRSMLSELEAKAETAAERKQISEWRKSVDTLEDLSVRQTEAEAALKDKIPDVWESYQNKKQDLALEKQYQRTLKAEIETENRNKEDGYRDRVKDLMADREASFAKSTKLSKEVLQLQEDNPAIQEYETLEKRIGKTKADLSSLRKSDPVGNVRTHAKAEQRLAEQKARYQRSVDRRKEQRKLTEILRDTAKVRDRLISMAKNPTASTYIPKEMVQGVISVVDRMDKINTALRSEKVRQREAELENAQKNLERAEAANHGWEITPAERKVNEAAARLRNTEHYLDTLNREIQDLKETLVSLREQGGSESYTAFEMAAEQLSALTEDLRDTPVSQMTRKQAITLNQAMRLVERAVKDANRVTIKGKEKALSETRKKLRGELEDLPQKSPAARKIGGAALSYATPLVFFEEMSGYAKDSEWLGVYNLLNDAQTAYQDYSKQSSSIFDDLLLDEKNHIRKEYKELHNRKVLLDVGLRDESGTPVEVTRDMMLALYLNTFSNDNMRHVLFGGVSVPDLQKYYKGNQFEAFGDVETKRAVTFGENDLAQYYDAEAEAADKLIRYVESHFEEDSLPFRHAERAKKTADPQSAFRSIENSVGLFGSRADIAAVSSLLQNYEKQRKAFDRRIRELSEEIRKNLKSHMTEWELQLCDRVSSYFNGYAKELLNRATTETYGYEKATKQNYYPIHTDKAFLEQNLSSYFHGATVEGYGAMKSRTKSEKPILLEGMTDVLQRELDRTARYAAYLKPMNDLKKILGASEADRETLLSTVETKRGARYRSYLEKLIRDLSQPSAAKDSWERVLGKLRGNYARAVFTGNLKAGLGSIAAYPVGAHTLGFKPLAKALATGGPGKNFIYKADRELIDTYSSALWYRSQYGLAAMHANTDATSKFFNDRLAWANTIEVVDNVVVGRFWTACEFYVDEHYPGLEKGTPEQIRNGESEYYKKVAEVFRTVIEETEANYSTMQRPQILRSDSALTKSLTMFQTQNIQNANIVTSSYKRWARYRSDFKAGKNGITKTDVDEAGNRFRRALATQIVQNLVYVLSTNAVLFALTPGRYDDDDEETTMLESSGERLLLDFMDTTFASIPVIGEVYSIIANIGFDQYYDGVSVTGVDAVSDSIDSWISVIKDLADGPSWKKTPKKWMYAAEDTSKLFGIPLSNAKKIIQAIPNWIEQIKKWE